jgi:hypothetical protein
LVRNLADRHFGDIDLLGARQFQQEMQRTLERIERQQQRIAPLRLLGRAEIEL